MEGPEALSRRILSRRGDTAGLIWSLKTRVDESWFQPIHNIPTISQGNCVTVATNALSCPAPADLVVSELVVLGSLFPPVRARRKLDNDKLVLAILTPQRFQRAGRE
jgi:hypothetical protein